MKITKNELLDIKRNIKNVKIGVIGDGCIDIYWDADMKKSKLSRETPHYPLPIIKERFYLGAASNVLNNLYTLGADVQFLTVIGDDWRGREFKKIIKDMNVDDSHIITSNSRWTPAYCKPIRHGISEVVYEDPRLDFENHSPISADLENEIIHKLQEMSRSIDVLIVSDQFYYGIITENVIKKLFELKESGLQIVVDSRENIVKYKGLFIKPNEVEVYELLGEKTDYSGINIDKFLGYSKRLWDINKHDMVITLGGKGAILIEEEAATHIPTTPLDGEIDIVGCGDAFISGFSLGLSLGFSEHKSIELANLIAGIVIKKIGVTGAATLKEVFDKYDTTKQ